MDKFIKCKSCKNFDAERSNANWNGCSISVLSVALAGTSEGCESYTAI